jgi:hypothetical protein
MRRLGLAVFLYCLLNFLLPDAEASFSKQLAEGRGESIIETSDGGYLLTGFIIGPYSTFTDSFVVKLNASGKLIWKRRFKGPANITGSHSLYFHRALEVSDGYVFAADVISDQGTFALVKLDLSGKLIWSKSFENIGFLFAGSLAATAGGGFVLSGTFEPDFSTTQLLVMKFDSFGNVVWEKAYGFPAKASSIVPITGGGYLLAGGPDGNEIDTTKFVLLNLSPEGNIRSKKILTISQYNAFGHFIKLKEGGYILVASHFASHQNEALVIRFTASGGILWSKLYGGFDGEGVAEATDGTLLVAAETGFGPSLILKLDLSGNVLWKHEFGKGRSLFSTTAIVSSTDGGGAVTGSLTSQGGNDFAYVLKFDPIGNIRSCNSFTNPDLPITSFRIRVGSQAIQVLTPSIAVSSVSIQDSSVLRNTNNFCP